MQRFVPTTFVFMFVLLYGGIAAAGSPAVPVVSKPGPQAAKASAAYAAVKWFVQALSTGDRVTAGRYDFACQYRLVSASQTPVRAYPADEDPVYTQCWERLTAAHDAVVQQRDQGVYSVWPGKGSLVFFSDDLSRYAPSFFVMDRLGLSPPGTGIHTELLDTGPLPAASFSLREGGALVSATATLVRMRVTYHDAITSPVTYAPGTSKWTNTVRRPRQALKTVTVKWVVLMGLRKFGFPGDIAVLNLPVVGSQETGGPVPFVTDPGGYVPDSAAWWQPADASGLLLASVGRASQFPQIAERVSLLNRVLLIDPAQPDALSLLSRDLYQTLLTAAAELHQVPIADRALAATFSELYWDIYAQTTRVDIALDMERGGLSKPGPADYLYRMIPAMERLAKVRPEDLVNRLRLGAAYRWNNDQLAAIRTHETLLKDVPPNQQSLRTQALIELAWSRTAKVSWNRTFDDPGIAQAYREAEEALKLSETPLNKFLASYTMAYSLLFTPNRDNHLILERLTQARESYLQIAGATPESWRYLLANDNLKGVIETDPSFKPLLAAAPIASRLLFPVHLG